MINSFEQFYLTVEAANMNRAAVSIYTRKTSSSQMQVGQISKHLPVFTRAAHFRALGRTKGYFCLNFRLQREEYGTPDVKYFCTCPS